MLADTGYAIDHAFRSRLSELGLHYVVGVNSALVRRCDAAAHRHTPAGKRQGADARVAQERLSDDQLAEGTNETLSGRFAAVRVRHAGGNVGRARLRPEEWLLIERSADEACPRKYYLSTLPADTPLNDLVATTLTSDVST